jgi:predicted MPP superfamily phosphohydrolase
VNAFALLYLAVVSLLAVIMTVSDKSAAKKNAWRVKERSLFVVAALGGSAAMLLTMLVIRHKTHRAKFMVGIPLILVMQISVVVFAFDSRLTVSRYEVESDKINRPVTLALVTDLHSCNYGDGQKELLNALNAESPDAVLLCGDIFDDGLPPDNAEQFVGGVSAQYPCYYVSGNHEFWSGIADDFKAILESYGVTVLAGTTEILEISNDRIRICGIDDPDTDKYPSRSATYAEQLENLRGVSDDGTFTVLMSHRPERMNELLPLKPDLVVSGHAHGGQWRLPVLLENGLLSPNQGLFPKYANGEYFFGEAELIVSRGLARESTIAIPRIFNRPELVIIEIR